MEQNLNKTSTDNSILTPKSKERLFILLGFLVLLTWILLFVVGMFIDSSYYRIAINYGFFDWKDIVITTLSFTVSNVALLAFLAALLGGICSLIVYSEGFTLSKEELKAKNVSNILYENPFISAFRGVFLFLAVLSIQYVSSFSDMSLLGNNELETKQKESVKENKFYAEIIKTVKDTAIISSIQKIIMKEQEKEAKNNNEVLIENIIKYKDTLLRLEQLKDVESRMKKELIKNNIKGTLKKMKLEKKDELPGISTASYFKFAIIVSLLAFLCGYDPSKFNTFLANVPFIKGQSNDQNVTTTTVTNTSTDTKTNA
jgi:hypothetical protein